MMMIMMTGEEAEEDECVSEHGVDASARLQRRSWILSLFLSHIHTYQMGKKNRMKEKYKINNNNNMNDDNN